MPIDSHLQHLEEQLKDNDNQMESIMAKSDIMEERMGPVTSNVSALQK